jgi:hypothetical protein
MEPTDSVEVEDTVEAPKRSTKSPAQLETIKKARDKKAELDKSRLEERERLKAEARFDKLLELFDQVRIQAPEVPEVKVSRAKKPKAEEPVEKPRPQVQVRAEEPRKVSLRFC